MILYYSLLECRVGKRVYRNKSRWHPILSSHGIYKCVTCKCKVSILMLSYSKCSKWPYECKLF